MPTNILMPALSPTMEKGNLAKWLKKEGDAVKAGDVIAEIETDKATMEVEAVDEGVLAKLLVAEGTADVPVNQPIAVLAGEGEDPKTVGAGDAPAAKKPEAPKQPEPPKETPRSEAAPPQQPPAPNKAAPAAAPASQPAQTQAEGERVFSSPLARRLAKEGGLDLAQIKGSGPRGRVVERDVQAAMEGGAAQPVAAAEASKAPETPKAPSPAAPASNDAVRKLFPPGSFEEVPHDGMRKTIARRLLESKQTIPHFYLTLDCELDALLALREQLNGAAPKDKDGKPAYKLSVNDLVIKAMAMALRRVPDANVSWTETAMLKHKHADVGVAVAIPGGLITPVIRDACGKSLSAISNGMKDLAARARNRKLKPEEYRGGTTAISNLGMFGIKDFAAVINPPHATILAVGAGEKRAVVKDGQLAVATVMSVTLSTDHRAVDGALGAELLQAFKGFIEQPFAMLV